MTPSAFAKKYDPLKVYTETGWKYVPVKRYTSGEPRNKKFVKEALWDLECFVKKQQHYEESRNRFTGSHHQYEYVFISADLVPPWVPISWADISRCFYGKGSPTTFTSALRVVDHYLNHAKMSLSYLGWKSVMRLEDYAYWYLGLDCNGFAGAYYAANYPSTGINGGDHINYLEGKATLAKRQSVADLKTGDMLVRKGNTGEGNRHVVLLESIAKTGPEDASATVVHSASTRKGLATESMLIKKLSGTTSDSHGTYYWRLVGYRDFHWALGPK